MAKVELVVCKECGKERYVQRSYMLKSWFTGLCRICARKSRSGEKNPRWRGGRSKTPQGYIDIRLFPDDPFYPMASKHWHYCREHRYLMAKSLGRCLTRQEAVHHINGIRDDNRLENLELISPASHRLQTMYCHNCYTKKEIRKLHFQIKQLLSQISELQFKS